MDSLRGQHVLITGAAGGLGPAVVEAVLACGATVTATSRRRTALDALRADLRHSDRLHVADADPTDAVRLVNLFDAIERGTGPLAAVVHCVGGYAGGKLVELEDATISTLFEAVLRSTVLVTRESVRRMAPRGHGRVVLIGSLASRAPSPNMAYYGALKAAVAHFAQSVADENRSTGVKVNAVLPGTMATDANRKAMRETDASRWVEPRDVAKTIATLLGDGAAAISGGLIALPDRMW